MLASYNPKENDPRKRRKILRREVKRNGLDSVKFSLSVRKGKAQGYISDRIRADLNWIEKKFSKKQGFRFI